MAKELELLQKDRNHDRKHEHKERPAKLSKGHSGERNRKDFTKKERKRPMHTFDSSYYCMYHGKDKDHDTNECIVLKEQARRMCGRQKAQTPRGRKDYNAKKEIAAMLGEVTETVFAKHFAVKKRKVSTDPLDVHVEDQMLAAFGNASISDKSSGTDNSSLSTKSSVKSTKSTASSPSSSSSSGSESN